MKFTKELLRPGSYYVPFGFGKRHVQFDADRIDNVFQQTKRMLDAGVKIPVPTRHLDEAVPVRLGSDADDIDAYNNTGWLEDVEVREDGSLYGVLDIKDRKVQNKLKNKSIEHVSPVISKTWLDPDTGDSYEDAMTHVALVTHPIQTKQGEFVSDDQRLSVSLAQYDGESHELAAPPFAVEHYGDFGENNTQPFGSIETLVRTLKEKLDLVLPTGTDATNIVERLTVAVLNYTPKGKSMSDSIKTPPKGSGIQQPHDPSIAQSGVAFSQEAQEQLTKLSQQNDMLLKFAQDQVRASYESRIKHCIETGRITQDDANKVLVPLLGELKLELSQGEPQKQHIDVMLEYFESKPAASAVAVREGAEGKVQFSMGGVSIAQPPKEQDATLADEAAAEAAVDIDEATADKLVENLKQINPAIFAN